VACFTSAPLHDEPRLSAVRPGTPGGARENAHRNPCSVGARWAFDGPHRVPSGPIETPIRWAWAPGGGRCSQLGNSSESWRPRSNENRSCGTRARPAPPPPAAPPCAAAAPARCYRWEARQVRDLTVDSPRWRVQMGVCACQRILLARVSAPCRRGFWGGATLGRGDLGGAPRPDQGRSRVLDASKSRTLFPSWIKGVPRPRGAAPGQPRGAPAALARASRVETRQQGRSGGAVRASCGISSAWCASWWCASRDVDGATPAWPTVSWGDVSVTRRGAGVALSSPHAPLFRGGTIRASRIHGRGSRRRRTRAVLDRRDNPTVDVAVAAGDGDGRAAVPSGDSTRRLNGARRGAQGAGWGRAGAPWHESEKRRWPTVWMRLRRRCSGWRASLRRRWSVFRGRIERFSSTACAAVENAPWDKENSTTRWKTGNPGRASNAAWRDSRLLFFCVREPYALPLLCRRALRYLRW